MWPSICSSVNWRGEAEELVGIRGRSGGSAGCLLRSYSMALLSSRAGLSLEHKILTAALMLPSSSFDATAAATVWSSLILSLLLAYSEAGFAEQISSHFRVHSVGKHSTRFLTVDVRLCLLPPRIGCSSMDAPKVTNACQRDGFSASFSIPLMRVDRSLPVNVLTALGMCFINL